MKEAIGFRCDYCTKMSANAGAMAVHEKHCSKNPNNLSMCNNCHWLDYPQETERVELELERPGDNGYEYRTYEIEIESCPFVGKLYYNFKDQLEEKLKELGWSKKPRQTEGCKYFLHIEDVNKIVVWARNNCEKSGIDNSLYIGLRDIPVTPELICKYFKFVGNEEEAKRFEL